MLHASMEGARRAELRALVDRFAFVMVSWGLDGRRAAAVLGARADEVRAILAEQVDPCQEVETRMRLVVAVDAATRTRFGDAGVRHWLSTECAELGGTRPLDQLCGRIEDMRTVRRIVEIG